MATSATLAPPPPPPRSDALSSLTLDGITLSIPDDTTSNSNTDSDSDSDHDSHEASETASSSSSSSFVSPSSRSAAADPRAPSQLPRATDPYADDQPPAFPALNSAQRQSGPSTSTAPSNPSKPSSVAATFLSTLRVGSTSVPPSSKGTNALIPPPSAGLGVPPSTSASSAPPGVGGASGATLAKGERRKKVALAPGCSPLDWAKLKHSTDLRGGITTLLRITPTQLRQHNTRTDAWSAFYGKVYNITPYLRFHPGGEDDLLRVAGRDGTRLFALTHSWVNIDAMIDTAMVGVLVQEP